MAGAFEELDFQSTAIGDVSLRRRREPRADDTLVYEVKLGDEFLMSSLFTVGEQALADRALERWGKNACDVVVGGLGLGYTAQAALKHESVRELLVVEALAPVIDWHQRGLVPLGCALSADRRCRFIRGDFFALAQSSDGFDSTQPGRQFDAILLDIDHSPRHHLVPAQSGFYTRAGMLGMARQLRRGGIFSLWSNDPPDDAFMLELDAVFSEPSAEIIEFPNPYSAMKSTCTIYSARAKPG